MHPNSNGDDLHMRRYVDGQQSQIQHSPAGTDLLFDYYQTGPEM